jgi:6-phosphogluconate dehydrogenase
MQLGLIGLGRMGMNMARRLISAKHNVVVFNRTQEKVDAMVKEGATGAHSLDEFVKKLKAPRVVWLMLPAGPATDEHIESLIPLLSKGDIIIDGGNSYFKEDIRRAEMLAKKGLRYMDAGVSGGIWGLKLGYCAMVGGDKKDSEVSYWY